MKKTTRISALILILALLMNLSGAAFATSEGIPIGDLEMSDLQMLTTAALEEEESQEEESITGDLDDPWGIIGECGEDNVYCGYVKYMLEKLSTAQERYDYMMDLYADPEDVVALEMTMAHYYGKAVHRDTNLLCTCNFPSYMPEYQVGIVVDEDGNALVDEEGNEVKHAVNCPWNFNNLSTAEQFELISTDDANLKAQFEEVMSADAAEKLSRVNAKEYMAEADAATVQIDVPENAFAKNYILTANETALSEEESAALAAEEAANVLAAFDISFPSLADEDEKLQPAESVPLTFTVDVSGVEGESVRVFHIKDGGSVEFVGEPVTIEKGAKSVTIEVEAESFSKWGVDLWFDENGDPDIFIETTPDYFPAIGYLDKVNFDEFIFFVESSEVGGNSKFDNPDEIIVPAEDCPENLILFARHANSDGSKVIYEVDSIDDDFYLDVMSYGNVYVYAGALSEVVPVSDFHAVVPRELSESVELYKFPSFGVETKSVSAEEFAGEYKIEKAEYVGYTGFYKLVPDGNWPQEAEGYNWVMYNSIAQFNREPLFSGENAPAADAQWVSDNNAITLTYNYEGAGEYVYTWYVTDETGSWKVAEDNAVTDNKLSINVTEAEYAALTKTYKCIVTNDNKIVAISPVQSLVNDKISSWLMNENDEIVVTMEMAKRAFEVGALDKLRVEGSELISVYSGEAVADIVEYTEIEGYTAKLVDRSMGLTVAYVTADGMVVGVDSDEKTEVETTNA